MHQELAKKEISVLELSVIGIVLLILIMCINVLPYYNIINPVFGDLLTLLMPFILLRHTLKRYKTSYKYTIISEDFIIKQLVGKNEKTLLHIKIDQIDTIKKGHANYRDKRECCTIKKFINNKGYKEKRYYCIYMVGNDKYYFEFEPSVILLEKIKRINY